MLKYSLKGYGTQILSSYRVQGLLYEWGSKCVIKTLRNGSINLHAALHHSSESFHEESLPLGWYQEKFPKLIKLSNLLKNVDLVDGKLIDINDNSTVNDERLLRRMHKFKALSRVFLGNPSVQKEVMRNVRGALAGRHCKVCNRFTKSVERDPVTIDTISKVCNSLNISPQHRKIVRATLCRVVTQHRIWAGALEEILLGIKTEIELLDSHQKSRIGTYMGHQIAAACLDFLGETACRQDDGASSWMRPKPAIPTGSTSSRIWEEVLEMFRDLKHYLECEKDVAFYYSKVVAMEEGLCHIKDVRIDRDTGLKEVLRRESEVQKRLSKDLGLPSRCMFTLLRYFFHRSVHDMEVDVSGGLCKFGGKDEFCLYMGKFLTSDEENMVCSGIKQLDRALELFKLVWDTAYDINYDNPINRAPKVEKILELQGHLWCVGAESRTITYRGNLFFLHGINPD